MPPLSSRKRSPRLRRFVRRLGRAGLVAIGAGVAVALFTIAALRWVTPPTTAFMVQHRLSAWRTGTAISPVRHRWVDWTDINPELALAVVAAEDQRFPEHHGFDFEAIRDALAERFNGGPLRGASTISQQVAKNLFLWPGRSFVRKGLEGSLTVMVEMVWSKRRILEVYLNVVEFGEGVDGVGAASQTFFARPPSRIDREQAALLAAVLPAPSRLSVLAPSSYVRSRQSWILKQMALLGGTSYLSGL